MYPFAPDGEMHRQGSSNRTNALLGNPTMTSLMHLITVPFLN